MELSDVAAKYNVKVGHLQRLQDHSARFASMIATFCERMGWSDLELLVGRFQNRVFHGVKPEVVPLADIKYVKGYRARLLFQAGFRTPNDVAAADVDQLATVLAKGGRIVL